MKAAVLHRPGTPLSIEDVAISKPGPREVLVRTAAVGMCHSDLHFIDGLFPYSIPVILGHEAAGIVEQVGSDVVTVKPGDHVITCVTAFCGHCANCVTGRLSLCESSETQRKPAEEPRLSYAHKPMQQFYNLSAYAEQMLVHENAVVSIRKDMPLDRAALLGCAVLTGTGAVFNTAGVRPGATVAVLGCGGIGLSAINGAALAGAAQIIAIDTLDSKLELARQFGATDVINVNDSDPVQAVKELTRGGVQYSFECIGLKRTAEQAFEMLRRGGAATLIGMVKYGTKLELDSWEMLQERRFQGSSMGASRFPVDLPNLVTYYMQGRLNLDKLISQHIKLEQINEGFDELRRGELTRSVIVFDH
ncbi:alcohol dehydrogenase [Burkholderia stabilis]|uniref:Zn-dependent alcohol dehydrogenase n=1 Tax=Burkholderia stabilis TaxID=95485 RepID=UPI00085162CB|nr:Zn-dependent alcohol dehydrogenase [Burkholderia stabilis]AOR73283.1 alcohol dehydrogenase [Burkholderia stabilis]HDR9494339.1 Zn-dependent alcohol dehydrogenase [Burkholderia stabilis]HDR9541307.1 Zn-dependent alcohol dehydrogenase [Burkholderia stabilis]HDR9570911.1 Zn-dependent alcohol dehydrogenase [Burkholderia stabilis]HDR9579189.1 Zn-dependent alcohol dehydrogenase [Burkholderia stabilis]